MTGSSGTFSGPIAHDAARNATELRHPLMDETTSGEHMHMIRSLQRLAPRTRTLGLAD
jgi:hypothetical protein